MVYSTATTSDCAVTQGLPDPGTSDPLVKVRTDRDRLTHLLRAVAADLDDLDRRLSDLAWRRARSGAQPHAEDERSVLHRQREALDSRLHVLAGQLRDLDGALESYRDSEQWPQARVGTCPDCGYPSLESRLCAICRRYLAGPNPLRSLISR